MGTIEVRYRRKSVGVRAKRLYGIRLTPRQVHALEYLYGQEGPIGLIWYPRSAKEALVAKGLARRVGGKGSYAITILGRGYIELRRPYRSNGKTEVSDQVRV